MVLDGAIHGANGFGEGHPPPLDSFRAARTGRAESKAEAKAKRQPWLPFSWVGQIPLRSKGI
jgi:hypothetical protein